MNLGRVSSAALMLSGISGVLTPRRVASALELSALSPRGVAETRAGLGGTYAALGAWAKHQVIGISEHDVGAGRADLLRMHAFDRRLRADRHESRRANDSAGRRDLAEACLPIGREQAERE